MGKTLISRRGGVRGVSVGACAAALAVSLTFASTALAETAPDAPFGEPVAADAGFAQGASAGAYAADAGDGMIYEEPDFNMSCRYVALSEKNATQIEIRRILR